MPYNLLFDIGNVIVFFDFQITIRRIADQCTLSPNEIFDSVREFLVELELGKIDPDEFFDLASKRIGYSGEKNYLKESLENVFDLNQPMVDLIEAEAEKGTPLYLLSNTNDIHVPHLFATYPVFGRFNQAIYSHKVGLMKPDPKIFEETISQLSIDPTHTIYIDDLPENCEAGSEAGFQAICYRKNSHPTFLSEFSEKTQID